MKLAPSQFALYFIALALATAPLGAQPNGGNADPGVTMPAEISLENALTFALEHNFSIREAKERIRQQEGVVIEVKAQQIPNLSATGNYQQNSTVLGFNGQDHNWSVYLNASQILYAGGGVKAGVHSQKLQLEAAMLELRSVINDALLDVRTRFYTVLVNRARIKVQEQSVELLQRQLQDVKNRFEAGTVSNFEVLRAEVALANAQPELITARNDFRLAIEQLRLTLGYSAVTVNNVTQTPEFIGELGFSPVSYDLVSALATARENRPDLQLLQKRELAAAEGVTVKQSNYYPNLSLFGSYAWLNNRIGEPANQIQSGWIIGLQSNWAIFDGRATAGRVTQARSLLQQAKLSTEEAQLAVDVDVRRSISTLQQATELAEASKKVVGQATEAVRLAEARFSAGTATQLDVLTSEVDLTTARLNQLRAYYTFNIAVVTLRKSMGLSDEMVPTGK